MSSPSLIGLDLGSTRLKAAAFRVADGAVLAQAGAAVPWQRNPLGACEVPGAVLDGLLQQVLQDLLAQLGPRIDDVRGLACAGHGGGLYVLAAQHELATGMAVSSTDQRARGFAAQLGAHSADRLAREVGCGPWAGQPTMIAAQIEKDSPGAFAAARSLFFAKDYLAWRLCGALATDYTDASTAGLLDTASGRPAAPAFAASDVPGWGAQTLAPLRASGQPLGQVHAGAARRFGLPQGLPVAMGAIDLFAAMTGAGCTQPGDTAAVFGTWCVNAALCPPGAAPALPARGLSNLVLLDAGQRRMAMNNGASSMANLAWLSDTLFDGDRDAVLEAAFAGTPGANGLRFIPFINGGGGNASAGFVGLRAFHGRADMARAVLEAIVALHASSLEALRTAGLPRTRLFALGGGAADARIAALLATMLDEAVLTPGADETGARGAALFAAQSLGLPTDGLPAPCRLVAPLPDAGGFYRGFVAAFDQLLVQLAPVFAHLQPAR